MPKSKQKRRGPIKYGLAGAIGGGLVTGQSARALGGDIKAQYAYRRQPVSQGKAKEFLKNHPEARQYLRSAQKRGDTKAVKKLMSKIGGVADTRVKPFGRYKAYDQFVGDQVDLLKDVLKGKYDSAIEAQTAFTQKFHRKFTHQQQSFLRGLQKPLKHRGKVVWGLAGLGAAYGLTRKKRQK